MCLLSLLRLREFVNSVFFNMKQIPDEERRRYRGKYIPKIEELKCVLDEERMDLIVLDKEYSKDLSFALKGDKPDHMWYQVFKRYEDEYRMRKKEEPEQSLKKYKGFFIKSSEMGFKSAHPFAAYFLMDDGKVEDAENCIFRLFESNGDLEKNDIESILNLLNMYLRKHDSPTEKMKEIVRLIEDRGFKVTEDKNDSEHPLSIE